MRFFPFYLHVFCVGEDLSSSRIEVDCFSLSYYKVTWKCVLVEVAFSYCLGLHVNACLQCIYLYKFVLHKSSYNNRNNNNNNYNTNNSNTITKYNDNNNDDIDNNT